MLTPMPFKAGAEPHTCLAEHGVLWVLHSTGVAPGVKVAVEIGHLRSYEHMGHARITCEGGCGCEPTILDGTWEHRYSLTDMAELEVRDVGEGCVLRFEVLPETSSPDGEHKVRWVMPRSFCADLAEDLFSLLQRTGMGQ